jgi:fructan beta-fructosidase
MMKKLLIISVSSTLIIGFGSALSGDNLNTHAPALEWYKGYGTDGGDHAHFVMQTSDGGYIMTGESRSRNQQRILVVKTDSDGDKQWQKSLGGSGEDLGNYICETADGSFIVAGAIDKNRALIKLSASGNIVWEKTYPGSGRDAIEGIDLTSDGGIIATGYMNGEEGTTFIIHDGQAFLMKTDANGYINWEKDLSPTASQGFKLREVDNGYVISAVSPRDDGNFCLIKTDRSGNIKWHKEYGGDKEEDLYDFDVTSDGGYILAGHKLVFGKVSENTDVFDFWLVKVDHEGNLEWDRTFGQPRGYYPRFIRDECYGIRQTPDGGYIMCGGNGDETRSFSANGSPYGPSDIWQVYLVKTDAAGNLLWQNCYGSTKVHDAGEYIGLTSDGGYIIASDADSAGSDTYKPNNFGFMKIAPDTFTLSSKITNNDILIADFEGGDFGQWTTTGTGFGNRPALSATTPGGQQVEGFLGKGFASSLSGGKNATGTLTSPEFKIEREYINFLVSGGSWPDDLKVELIVGGSVVRSSTGNHDEKMYWDSWDVLNLRGEAAVIRVTDNSTREDFLQLLEGTAWELGHLSVDHFEQSDEGKSMRERFRPQFHFTPRYGFTNDPNGLVYYDGEYHLFHQYSPHARYGITAHWGHAVSTDLIHWKHLPVAITPVPGYGIWEETEECLSWSGSSVIDVNNTAGFQKGDEKTIVAFWSTTGCGQYISYSTDRGRTFTSWKGNPVIPAERVSRDPKVYWHEPTQKWVMALFVEREPEGIAFYTSDNLKEWKEISMLEDFHECPDFFKLPVEGDTDKNQWIIFGAHGAYKLGTFDGRSFTVEDGPYDLCYGNFYASQTFANIPQEDGRRILITWVRGPRDFHGMPFSQQLGFPMELKLRTFPEGQRVCLSPVKEIELLHDKRYRWTDITIEPGNNLLTDIDGDLFHIKAEFEVGTATEFGFKIHGQRTVSYNSTDNSVYLSSLQERTRNDEPKKIKIINNRLKIEILVDRASVDAFFDEGRVTYTSVFFPEKSDLSLELFSTNGTTQLISMDIYKLKSAWDRPN